MSAALAKIRAVVGEKHVLAGWDQLEPRARDTLPSIHAPSAIVYPGSVDEVRAVVGIACELEVPLWPVSRGRNWAYGAATPNAAGTIVLALERLDRIVEVNVELAYAVLEPGVTFGQLQEHLDRNDIPLWIDPTDSTPHGSVVGNALDRGLGTTPYGDHFGNLCGAEVVLADGRLLQTNGAADSNVRHTYKWGTGPYLEGLFSQSGAGVVVRAGVWLMPKPEAYRFYLFELGREEDLPHVVDALRRVVLEERVRTRIHLINDVTRIALASRCPFPPRSERTHLSDAELGELRRRHGLPSWLLGAGIYGTHAQVRDQERELRRAIGQYGRLRFVNAGRMERARALIHGLERARRLPGLAGPVEALTRRLFGKSLAALATFPHAFERAAGRPTEHFLRFAYYKARRLPPDVDVDPARDGGGLIWCAPSLPFSGRHLTELLEICRPLYRKHGFDFAVAVMPHNARTVALVMAIHYYKDDPAETARAEALYARLREATAEAGYPPYRVSAPHQDGALAHAPTFWEIADRVGRALDPDGIIAPGRYGVGGRRGSVE